MTRLLPDLGRILLTILLIAGAILALVLVWRHYEDDPWTRDGALQADVVQVSADVAGLVTQIHVHDNQPVRAGDLLFTVDQERYAAQLAQADAAVASAQAGIANARATITNAQATLSNALREKSRYVALGNLVSQEERDTRITTVDKDQAALVQARAGLQSAQAGLKQAEANKRLAQVNMDHSAVRAKVNGYITGFSMRPGDYVAAGSPSLRCSTPTASMCWAISRKPSCAALPSATRCASTCWATTAHCGAMSTVWRRASPTASRMPRAAAAQHHPDL
jgi:multidrug resistance efflux pump